MDSGINSEDWDYEDLDWKTCLQDKILILKTYSNSSGYLQDRISDSEVSNDEISGKHLDSINNGDGNPRLSEGEMGDKETDSSDDN